MFSLFLLRGLHHGVIKVPSTVPHISVSTFSQGTGPRRQKELSHQREGNERDAYGTASASVALAWLGRKRESLPRFKDVHFRLTAEERLGLFKN